MESHFAIIAQDLTQLGSKISQRVNYVYMKKIKEGDRVRHKDVLINGGLDMPVLEVQNDLAMCNYLDPKDKAFKDAWFKVVDLVLVHEGDGGFRNEGE